MRPSRTNLRPTTRRAFTRRTLIAVILLLLLGCGGGMILASILSTPATPVWSTDYGKELAALARKDLPADARNGWPALERAMTTLDEAVRAVVPATEIDDPSRPASAVDWTLAGTRPAADPSLDPLAEQDRRRADAVVAAFAERGGFDDLREAATAEYLASGRFESAGEQPLSALLDPRMLSTVRDLARAQQARLRAALRDGDAEAAARELETLWSYGRLLVARPILMDRLVGFAVLGLPIETIRAALADPDRPLDPAVLDALAETLDRFRDAAPIHRTRTLEGERLFLLDAVQWCYTDDGAGDGRLVPSRLGTIANGGPATDPVPLDVLGRFAPSRREVTAAIDAWFDALGDRATMPRSERPTTPLRPTDVAAVGDIGPLGDLLFVPMDRTLDHPDRHEATLAGTAIVVALARHARDHGAPPDALDELVPAYLDALPEDPYGGGPWGYRLDADAPLGCVLWSRGGDMDDDGGVPETGRGGTDADGDLVLTPQPSGR